MSEHCHHDCKHESIKFCVKCQKAYCEKCGREWEDKCTLNHYYPYYPNTTPTTPYQPWVVTYDTTKITGADIRQTSHTC
jgi:hypothetical protein